MVAIHWINADANQSTVRFLIFTRTADHEIDEDINIVY